MTAANARRAFALAASAFYPRRPQTIVAVTGTNGKSSTVDFLRQIWTHAGRRAASLGTLGAIGPSGVVDLGHTTPDPAAVHATLSALADSIPTPALSMLDKPAPATSINWMLELIGDPGLLDRNGWSLIGTDVRAGADGYLSQTSVLWGPGGHAFSVSHQSVAIFG